MRESMNIIEQLIDNIPEGPYAREWTVVIDTFDPSDGHQVVPAGSTLVRQGHSVTVLKRTA